MKFQGEGSDGDGVEVTVVQIAANHDGDSDTTASITGQIYGAWHGNSVLPKAWIEKLDIMEVTEKLVVEFMTAKGVE